MQIILCLIQNFVLKTDADRRLVRYVQNIGYRCRNVGEGAPRPHVDGVHALATDEERDVLSRVICTLVSRVTAVIGGDEKEIVGLEFRQKIREPCIEGGECRGVTFDAMPSAFP